MFWTRAKMWASSSVMLSLMGCVFSSTLHRYAWMLRMVSNGMVMRFSGPGILSWIISLNSPERDRFRLLHWLITKHSEELCKTGLDREGLRHFTWASVSEVDHVVRLKLDRTLASL